MTLNKVICRVKLGTELSDFFSYTVKGLKQWKSLSCQFNIELEQVIRDSGIHTQKTIFTKSVQKLVYADNIDIKSKSRTAIKEVFCAIESAAKMISTTVNGAKTKFMKFADMTSNCGPLTIKN